MSSQSNLDEVLDRMSRMSPCASSKEEKGDTSHDAVVLKAVTQLPDVMEYFHADGVVHCQLSGLYALEYELALDSYVDIALFTPQHTVGLLLEIKSKHEAQSASGWTRQIRRYAKAANAPCVLVVAHDLGDVQQKYLRIAGTPWLDLRTL